MAKQPEPCPYCHSTQLHLVHHLCTHAVCCQHCGACGPSERLVEKAVDLWNGVAHGFNHALPAAQASR